MATRLACLCAFAALIALAVSARAVEPVQPDRDKLDPILQTAAGSNWKVTTTSGGYALTSVKLFSLLPDVSPSSKANLNQRMLHARRTQLVIKVLFTAPDTYHQLVRRPQGGNMLPIVEAENAHNYFSCFQSGDRDTYAMGQVRDGPKYAVFLFSNISPYESIHPENQWNEYETVLDNLQRVFGNGLEEIED